LHIGFAEKCPLKVFVPLAFLEAIFYTDLWPACAPTRTAGADTISDVGGTPMLIVNDAHLALAGVASLEERCHYCSRPLAAYPLIMGNERSQAVYHVTCALELATDLLVDLATFFHPPAPYPPLFVLTAPEAASTRIPPGLQV
jgi:hypothetical protein